MPRPKLEQETIILYSPTEDAWHVSTDVPKHIRKYLPLLKEPVVQQENGETVYIEGYLNGTVGLRKKTVMTDEQKQAASERLRAVRQKGAM